MVIADNQTPAHFITAAAAVHRLSHATYVAAFERVRSLLEPIGLDLIDEEDASKLLPIFEKKYGIKAETELARYRVAREVSDAAGSKEDDDLEAFEAIPIETAADLDAYVAYMTEHAEALDDLGEARVLHRMAGRIADVLRERLAN